jgi:hypothetical protein
MKKFLVMLAVVCSVVEAKANHAGVDTIYDPINELAMIHAFYGDTARKSFQCTYFMQDIDSVTTHDTLIGYYKMHNEKFWIVLDSVESLQDDYYTMTAYHNDSMVFVQRREDFAHRLTHVNLYDPTLRNKFVDSITVQDSTASLRKLKFHFKSGAPYVRYEILYDTAHKIISINYSVRKYPYADIEFIRAYYFLNVRMDFTNYQFSGFTDDVFNTTRFAGRENGEFKLTVPYAQYILVNSMNQ